MAKQRGPVASTFTGKVGNVVGAKLKGGEYVTRAYQPEVKNPNTLRQQVSRNKMSLASKAAAALSEIIGIGYAKAAGGTKMYPRNMFVKDIVPVSGGFFSVHNGIVTLNPERLPVSHKYGIEIMPFLQSGEDQTLGKTVTAVNIGDVPLNVGENVALVVVAYDAELKNVRVKTAIKAASGDTMVNFTVAEQGEAGFQYFAGFYKIIPPSYNGVASTEIPWKYPSNTSAQMSQPF